ncbi:LysE family transporter [Moraxella sp. FZFQ2102]|uniref:LysE family transporter n=1 Tax=Moraxella sp. FZFQ2102 TaxID=2953752 RepID=UPI00209C3C76|nr:LysE family transporter [Moraxella sp. FZFQ2102]USZ14594.1 LysE family transporter [Moraxella sp. FZFQ2102]
MFGITDLMAYVLTVSVLIALPGPNSMFCFGTALTHGFAKARFAIMGTFLGNGTLIVASALGAGALLSRYPFLFGAIKMAGAVYLTYLGARLLINLLKCQKPKSQHTGHTNPTPNPTTDAAKAIQTHTSVRPITLFKKSLLIALLNPKGLVFFPAVMIQFVATDTTSPMIILLVLGMIFQCCSLMFLLILTKCSGLIGQKLNQFAWLNRLGQAGAGLIFLGFAARLAMA